MQNQINTSSTQLNHNILSIVSAVCGLIGFILLFFPEARVVTLLFGIVSVALGVWAYLSTRSWLSLVGILLGGFPLIFFLQLKLIFTYVEYYIKENSREFLEKIF